MSDEHSVKGAVPIRRKVGRPKKNNDPLVPEGKKPRSLLPVLRVDLTRDPADQVFQITEVEQARHLGWKAAEVRSVNSQLSLYDSLPMVCHASGCYWAPMCPTKPDFKFEGYFCPIETMDVYKYFLGYVRDLDITPTDYVDLRLVEDLIRIDLQLKRVDQHLSINGMEIQTVGGVIQSQGGKDLGGAAVWEKGAHPLLVLQDKLRNRRRDIHKTLIASRADKLERDRKEGKAQDNALDFIDRMMSAYMERPKGHVREELPAIEAVITSLDDYDDDNDEEEE